MWLYGKVRKIESILFLSFLITLCHLSALFDGNEVAVKISLEDDFMEQEIEIYRSLKAFSNPMIEKLGIPRAYYSGKIFEKYPALVITLFDESVENRHIKQDYSFNAYSTLQVFLQSVRKKCK